MGFMRKALFLGTGGLSGVAGVRANSKKERTAKAAEKQVRIQQQMFRGAQQTTTSAPRRTQATVATFRIPCVHCGQHIRVPAGKDITCLKCGQSMDVVRRGGYGFYRIKAVVPVRPALGRIISED
jgi:membrane protease subunit (stomatin/prohibitin family)